MTYLVGEILVHLIGAFLAGLALGWLIWGLGRRAGRRRGPDETGRHEEDT